MTCSKLSFEKKDFNLLRTLHANFNPQKEVAHQNHGLTFNHLVSSGLLVGQNKLCPNLPNSPSSGVVGGWVGAILAWVPSCLPPFVPWGKCTLQHWERVNSFVLLVVLGLTYLTTFVTTQLSPICPWGKDTRTYTLLLGPLVFKSFGEKRHI